MYNLLISRHIRYKDKFIMTILDSAKLSYCFPEDQSINIIIYKRANDHIYILQQTK